MSKYPVITEACVTSSYSDRPTLSHT